MTLKTIIELAADADTTTTVTRETADAVYRLQPRIWLKTIIDAAKKRLYFSQFAYRSDLQQGQASLVIPRRRRYMGSGTGTEWAGTQAEGAAVKFTSMEQISGVAFAPATSHYGVAITTETIRKTAVDMVKSARDELTYVVGDEVDRGVAAALSSDTNKAITAVIGSQAIYGGDATQASELAAGNTLTVDMVAKAKRYLQSTICKVWAYGTSESDCTEAKNPWINEAGAPFVLAIAPEQEEVLLTDSQFVNASEYGDPSVIKNGEVGSYLGIKIVVANNTPYFAASATHADASTTTVAQHRCIMFKAQKAVGLVYGLRPRLTSFAYPSELEHRLIIEQAYQAKQIDPDAIVHVNVADA